jgi:Bacterial archaeo-eukaryotic release factor family 3
METKPLFDIVTSSIFKQLRLMPMEGQMDLLSFNTIDLLAQTVPGPCISIFVPLQRGKFDEVAARLELKNLVALARTSIEDQMRRPEVDELLAPAESLLNSASDWSSLEHGFGLFLSPTKSVSIRLPIAPEPLVMIGERFDLLPGLQMLSPDYEFHVLALSRNEITIYRGSRYGFEKMEVPDLPDSLDDALWYERHQNIQISAKDELKEYFDRFSLVLDRILMPTIGPAGLPLILAGVEREVSSFREASQHPNIMKEMLIGNPFELPLTTLHMRAWNIVRMEREAKDEAILVNRFEDLADTTRRSTDESEIFDAANDGRVDVLLLPIPSQTQSVPREVGGVDGFLNAMAAGTLTSGGTIRFVPAAVLPVGTVAGAIFRWASSSDPDL